MLLDSLTVFLRGLQPCRDADVGLPMIGQYLGENQFIAGHFPHGWALANRPVMRRALRMTGNGIPAFIEDG
ncbi:hypothetical protein [Paraburkholderia hayleyella]|uniref:hypothetical protein n=1 Tax=Paraburkholderia hayleyella TaxID=2152889 RepID=UPI001580D657|nr:hypothetical protein [Paraburkholderia hayleyella]